MGSRRRHVKNRNPRVYNSGLFGIVNNAQFTSHKRNSKVSFPVALNFKAQRSIRDAMIEAEFRKAQAITLTRQTYCM